MLEDKQSSMLEPAIPNENSVQNPNELSAEKPLPKKKGRKPKIESAALREISELEDGSEEAEAEARAKDKKIAKGGNKNANNKRNK